MSDEATFIKMMKAKYIVNSNQLEEMKRESIVLNDEETMYYVDKKQSYRFETSAILFSCDVCEMSRNLCHVVECDYGIFKKA